MKQIGTGAGSKIYLAVNVGTSERFAVKHVCRESPEDARFLEQAETEYQVASKLDHPNLRKAFSIKRVKRLLQRRELVLVFEYVDGLPLEKARPNRLQTFLTLFHKIAKGLHAMHQAGYIHTDIKPTNILIARGGIVKIIDFGQSCPLYHRKERIQGTPDYIAPEQVRRLQLDQRTDVFNLGATMYWVLTSEKYPTEIRGNEGQGNVLAVDKPVAPIELNDKIPVSLSNLVMDCCRGNPNQRPADMEQVTARLLVVEKVWKKYRDSLRNRDILAPGTDSKVTPPRSTTEQDTPAETEG